MITLLDELQALGVAFVSLAEGIDATTPAGKLQMLKLGAIAEFERARIAERVKVWMRRAKSAGRHVGRRRRDVSDDEIAAASHLSLREAATALGVSKSFLHAWRLSRRSFAGIQIWAEKLTFLGAKGVSTRSRFRTGERY